MYKRQRSKRPLWLAILGLAFYWGIASFLGPVAIVKGEELVSDLEGIWRNNGLLMGCFAIGIAIGIASMVAVLGISESSKSELVSTLDRLGTNLLEVGAGQGEATVPMVFSADETLDVGSDTGTPVSDDHTAAESRFIGDVDWVQLDIDDAAEDLDTVGGRGVEVGDLEYWLRAAGVGHASSLWTGRDYHYGDRGNPGPVHQPRVTHSSKQGRSLPIVVSRPWPGRTMVSSGSEAKRRRSMDSMMASKLPPSNEVAPGPPGNSVSPENRMGDPSNRKQMDPGVWPGVQMVWSRRRPTCRTISSSRTSS